MERWLTAHKNDPNMSFDNLKQFVSGLRDEYAVLYEQYLLDSD
jgi:hypothetical protein